MSPIYRSITYLDWMTLILLFCLVLLVLGKYLFKTSFFNFIILPFNNKYITLNKKKGKLFYGFHLIMSIFQIANLSLFLFISRNIFFDQPLTTSPEFYVVVIMGILVFLLVKTILQVGNGYFFENNELMTDIIFEKLTYFNYGGLIAFLGNVLVIYVFPGDKSIIYLIFLLLIGINGIGIIKILRTHQKLIIGNTFYFILYLCTLEISPIAVLVSYLNS
ncbi:DUF4271 domain-containing protein [Flavobacteriaceae bacterium GF1]